MRKNKKQLEIVRLNPAPESGLTKEQVKERNKQNLINNTKQDTGKSYLKIVFDNVFTFFNFIWVLIFVSLMAVQSYNDLLFVIAIIVNTCISIIQECKAKMTVEKLSLVTQPKVRAVRDGIECDVQATAIVLDDIIVLSSGSQVPADCIVLDGKVDANESLLTGESNAIKKNANDTLLAGSFIMSGTCRARVDRVGNDSYIQSIAVQAKKFKSPNSSLNRDLNSLIKYIGIFILPVAGLMFVNNFFSYNQNLKIAVTKTCGSITGMVPAGMFLLITIALAVGVIKLSNKKTLVQDLFSIEMLARSNILCLDKTGTITDGTMQVSEIIILNNYQNIDNEKIIANILNAQKTSNSTSSALMMEFGRASDFQMAYNMEFSSVRKFTATSFSGLGTFVIGAPEFVNCKLTKKLLATIHLKSAEGKRVLLLAHTEEMLDDKEKLGKNTTPLAFITIEDHIREDAVETIEWFKANGVEIKIISGDNPLTVSSIAKRVGVKNADQCVSLEGLSLQEVEKLASKFTVFGRVSPEQKHTLIKTLKKQGNIVAMTGDGVNDTLALKEADCSIAMADGSEVARNLSNLVLMDSKFASLPAVVNEGRQVVNNVQQSSTLYLMKTIFTIVLSLFTIVTLSGYPFQPVQLFILELFVIGIPSVLLALQPNTKIIKGDFIPVVLKRSVPSGLLMFLCMFVVLMLQRAGLLNAEEFHTLCTLVLTLTGFINLIFICIPFSKLKVSCVAISAFCIGVAIFAMGDFFGIVVFNTKIALLSLVIVFMSVPLHVYIPKFISWLSRILKKITDNTDKYLKSSPTHKARKIVSIDKSQLAAKKQKEDNKKQKQEYADNSSAGQKQERD